MHSTILSFTCVLALLSLSLIAPLLKANERMRFSDAITPVPYQIDNDGYTLYAAPLGDEGMINIILTPTMTAWDPKVVSDPELIRQLSIIVKPTLFFRGECAPAGTIHVGLTQIDTTELQRFEASSAIADFPYQAPLTIVREEIEYQCPDMQNITVKTIGDNLRDNIQGWQASLRSDNNWQLQAYNPSISASGSVSVSFRSHQTGIRVQPIEYNIGADYAGLCVDEVSVTLSVFPSADNGNSTPSLANYEWVSGNFTSKLMQHCPDLKKINYSLEPMPDEYNCAENCDIYASIDSRWSLETGQTINYSSPSGLKYDTLESYTKIIEALQVDEPKVIIGRVLFKSFYYRYLSHYSSSCRLYIEDPVPFQYVTTTTTSDGYGNEIGSNTEVSDNVTYVERAYAEKYDQYYGASNAKGLMDIFGSVMSGKSPNASNMAYAVMREDEEIIRHLREGCTSEPVQKVYANLYKLAHR
ncbi:hypothetical protein [Glaciecola sp. SC05]|uniref:hypothetical protein n=1 Tax=Glaciecola sp. SC05 TaxID=1987355 RepID=UPI0035282441